MTDDTTGSSTRDAKYSSRGIERVTNELHEVGLDSKRFIPLLHGTKAATGNHEQLMSPPEEITGNYGVYASNGLFFVDIDDYKRNEEVPQEIKTLLDAHPTFTVMTPHGGRHYYYCVSERLPARLEESIGRRNPTFTWGEIRTYNQYVVGPGSQLTQCNSPTHDCAQPGEGSYNINVDRPITSLPVAPILEALEELQVESPSREQEIAQTSGQRGLRMSEEQWIRRGREYDDEFDSLWRWAKNGGSPSNYGLNRPDRSSNEVALARQLFYRFGGFEDPVLRVRRIMNTIKPPKWSQRGKSYRDNVLESAKEWTLEKGEYYTLDDPQRNPNASGSRKILREHVDLLLQSISYTMEDEFRTTDLSSWHPFTARHTRQLLADLKEAGYLTHEQRGKEQYWIKCKEIPTTGREYKLLLAQYRTAEEVKEIRREYLRYEH